MHTRLVSTSAGSIALPALSMPLANPEVEKPKSATADLGFYIDPASTPARVTLGMVNILAVITNRSKLSSDLPSADSSWISDFLLMSLGFNIFSFTEQVAVNLGITAHRWLMTEQERSAKARKTAQAKLAGKYTDVGSMIKGLVSCREEVLQLFEEVDME